ncbi:MAG TPA: polysaccharide deacetylase family protein [Oscillatoriales cyanobacterium M59_W2019_021]|nr:polysaccharide deacetylase family protein [Oscillatoriales cyanobacterium M4454_W2019_049]HIK49822.1 polysaccharide deacetylase family protein [Oscillatoriales cyanobacterium M59_W2019_021]
MEFAFLYPTLYRILKPMFPDCLWSGADNPTSQSPTIALTFDDGPHPQWTPHLLDILDDYQIWASFFWLGACVRRSPEVARAVCERGHGLGLHGYDHRSFPCLSPAQLQHSLERTQEEISDACQLSRSWVKTHVRDVRPPNGLFLPQTLRHLHQWGYRPVMWSVVPEDWVHPGVAVTIDRVLSQVRPGSLIVLHDGIYGGKDVTDTVRQLVPRLRDRGYQFVTIDRLWQSISPNEWQGLKS